MTLWSFEQIQDDNLVFNKELRHRSIQGRFVDKYAGEEKKSIGEVTFRSSNND